METFILKWVITVNKVDKIDSRNCGCVTAQDQDKLDFYVHYTTV